MVMAAPPGGRAACGSGPRMRSVVVGLMMLGTPAMVGGMEPAARVTTDSREYCAELAVRLAALPGARAEPARSLAADGMRLCETGHPRTGVAKLRRALRAARPAD